MEGRRRHVCPATVDAHTFESDAGRSTDAVHLLNDTVQLCLVQNDSNNLGKLLEVLHARWSLAAPASCSVESVQTSECDQTAASWQLDCDALLALFYLSFVGGSVSENISELHLALFLAKWFHSTEGKLLQVAGSVHSSCWTDSFVTVTLLYCCLHRQQKISEFDIKGFLKALEKDRLESLPLNQAHPPRWLQQVMGSDTPYPKLITSLKSWIIFAYNIPANCYNIGSDGEDNKFSYLLHVTRQYQHHNGAYDLKLNEQPTAMPDCVDSSLHSSSVHDPTLKACLFWINGLIAAHKNKLSLAKDEFRRALETSMECSAVMYSAHVVFYRQGQHDTSLQFLRLLRRWCLSASPSTTCLPFTSALLAPLLPRPCLRGVTALLAGVLLRRQKLKEASDLLFALLADSSLPDDSGPTTVLHPRPLLLLCDSLPACPSRLLLRAQAVIAAARLNEEALLEEVLKATDADDRTEAKGWIHCYYNADEVSGLFCALLRISRRSSDVLPGALGLLRAYSGIPTNLNCHGRTPLLVITTLLCKAFLFTLLCRLHSARGNTVSCRHFQRLKQEALARVEDIAAVELKTTEAEILINVPGQIKKEEQLSQELDEPGLANKNKGDEVTGDGNLVNIVQVFCDSVNNSSNLNYTASIFLQNVAMFVCEQLEMG